jgi:transcriptional regulator with XRE-family HTH domain
MKLNEYIEEESITVSELSRRSGVPVVTLWRYVKGEQKTIKPETALAICEATDGKVSLLDLLFPDHDLTVEVRRKKP